MEKEGRFALTVAAHAWNADGTQLAICPNNNEVWLYEARGADSLDDWTRTHVLTGHDLLVSDIDWCPTTGKILTVSYDRNAFVWTFEGGKWEKNAVVLSLKFAVTGCAWAPGGNKFAVSSSSKAVQVCFWEPTSRWWVPRPLSRRFKSTVLAVAWHPNGQIVATAGCDYRVRVFSAFLEEVDGDSPDGGPFGEGAPFGTLLAEFDQCKTWVHDVAWSPGGNYLAFVTQASEVYIADFTNAASEAPGLQEVRHAGLPHRSCTFLSDKALVCGGHDMNPAVYTLGGDSFWRFAGNSDKAKDDGKDKGKSDSSFSAARALFAAKTTRGQSSSSAGDKITTRHQSAIAQVRPVYSSAAASGGGSAAAGRSRGTKLFSSAGDDGRVILWDASKTADLGL